MKIAESVIVLGAGASKAAHTKSGNSPPLDQNFLESATNRFKNLRSNGKHRDCVQTWKNFKKQISRAGLRFKDVKLWKLEQLSTFLEARANLRGLQLDAGQPKDYTKALMLLNRVVAHALQRMGGVEPCMLHKWLFESADPTAVITFNYDLIADQTLLNMGKLNWRRDEYTGKARARVPTADGGVKYQFFNAGRQDNTTRLIKLHGSMNWEKLLRGIDYRLSGVIPPNGANQQFMYVSVPDRPYIIPPVAAKMQIKEKPLRDHWYQALDFLHDAKRWIIWGYSFPQSDTIAQVLFRTALAKHRRKKPVFVVNPDPTAATRVLNICRKVEVKHYYSMEEFLIKEGSLKVTTR